VIDSCDVRQTVSGNADFRAALRNEAGEFIS
jgi:hypothetical protein